jgi:hypothetical protein
MAPVMELNLIRRFVRQATWTFKRTFCSGPYIPLRDWRQEIRIIFLESGQSSDSLRCTFLISAKDEAPDYTALSYVWGDPRARTVVSVDGVEVAVTENLATALRHLRSSNQRVLLWAEALCIYSHRTATEHLGTILRNAPIQLQKVALHNVTHL